MSWVLVIAVVHGFGLQFRSSPARCRYIAAWWRRNCVAAVFAPTRCRDRFVVDLRCIPLAETVGADSIEVQIVFSTVDGSVRLEYCFT